MKKLLKLLPMVKYALAIILSAIVSFMGINGCSQYRSSQKIKAIEVRDISLMMGETFYRVFYFDTLVMYQSQYRRDSFVNQLQFDSSTNQITSNNNLVLRQWQSDFFVFHRDSSYGYRYDPHGIYAGGRSRVDSAVILITGTNRWDSFLNIKPDTLSWNTERTELKEIYLLPKTSSSPSGQLNLYYSKSLLSLQESFNKIVDSVKKMKLFKTEVLLKEFYDLENKVLWPPSKNSTEMREISVKNPDEILAYVRKYKKSIGRGE